MRKILQIALLPALLTPLCAQNSDVSLLLNFTRIRWDFGVFQRTETRIGVQGSYARQLLEQRSGRLYLEVPASLFAPPTGEGIRFDGPGIISIARPFSIVFVTPGLRYHYNVTPRVALYAALGGGIALRQQERITLLPRPDRPNVPELVGLQKGWKGSPAMDVAGGVAFRLTRLLSLRGEFRTFRTTSVPGYGSGRNYPSLHGGMGFHF
ncbi:MAG: hypothetical protein JNK87_18055 [Bryobacterales bacterium]|nr:hypothetical protein [Bryobacterales bacterium]